MTRLVTVWSRLSLARKFAIGTSAIVIFQALALGLVAKVVVEDALDRSLAERGAAVAASLGAAVADDVLTEDRLSLRQTLQQVVSGDPTMAYVLVTGTDGRLLAHTLREDPPPGLLALLSLGSASGGSQSHRLLVNDEPIRHLVFPVVAGSRALVAMGLRESATRALLGRLSVVFPLVTLLALVACVTAALALGRSLSVPLRALADGLRDVGRGDLDREVHAAGEDEVGRLAAVYNRMLADLRRAAQDNLRMQRQVIQAEKMAAMGTFVAGMAHQVNNPLAGLLGCLDMMESTDDPARRKEYRELARNAAGRLSEVVGRLLGFGRMGTGAREDTCLDRILRDTLPMLDPEARRRKVRLEYRGDGSATLRCDVHGVQDVLVNLVLNALEATPPDGTVRVTVGASGDDRTMVVEDSGAGIHEDLQPRVFEPFFTTKADGTGLGLYVVQWVATQHGGLATVDRSPLGGARFTLTLPACPPPPLEVP